MGFRRANSPTEMARIATQLAPLTLKRVDEMAAMEGISRSFMVARLIEMGLVACREQQRATKVAS